MFALIREIRSSIASQVMENMSISYTGERPAPPSRAFDQGNNSFQGVNQGHIIFQGNLGAGRDITVDVDRAGASRNTIERRNLMQALGSDYESSKNLVDRRISGTCEWFFASETLRRWRDTKSSSILWISADPGCGKLVLARALIDEDGLKPAEGPTTVCYFFFRDGHEECMKSTSAICALLHQIFICDSTNRLVEHALAVYRNFGDNLPQCFDQLWGILESVAKDELSDNLVCILDGLDECERGDRKRLMLKLLDLCSGNAKLKLKFVITSRPYDDIERGFEQFEKSFTYLRFDCDEEIESIGRDIELVIDHRVRPIIKHFKEWDQSRIISLLKENQNRTYLWLFLTLNTMEDFPSRYGKSASIEQFLDSLPKNVAGAYQKLLDKSPDQSLACSILKLITAAARPLTLDEANIALSLATEGEDCSSLEQLDARLWPSDRFKTVVKSCCGLLVRIEQGYFHLLHQTTRQFVLEDCETSPSSPTKWKAAFSIPMAHHCMSCVCLQYLNMSQVLVKDETLQQSPSERTRLSEKAVNDLREMQLLKEFANNHRYKYQGSWTPRVDESRVSPDEGTDKTLYGLLGKLSESIERKYRFLEYSDAYRNFHYSRQGEENSSRGAQGTRIPTAPFPYLEIPRRVALEVTKDLYSPRTPEKKKENVERQRALP